MKTGKNNIQKDFEAIMKALAKFSGGASIETIGATKGLGLGLRTLQRRLEKLREQGQVITLGNKRSRLYRLARVNENSEQILSLIPLSKNGTEVLSLVSQPIQRRQPVGYVKDFLLQYRPNIDSYLTSKELSNLGELGNTARNDQPAGTYAKEIMGRLLIDLSWNSSRLEGNTYSLLDTERLIAMGEETNGKSSLEAQMILNHKDAIEFLVRDTSDIGFNRYTFLNLHALLSNNLLSNPAASGRLRSIAVGIAHSVYTPLAIPQLIEEMFGLMLAKAEEIENPFEQAFFIMVHLPYLQPFDDVNKRVSRLAANIPFNRHNLSPLSFVDVPNDLYVQGIKGIYEFNRIDLLKDVFMWAYERSAARYSVVRQSLGEPDPFRMKYRDELRALISNIVSTGQAKEGASLNINLAAQQIFERDRPKFIEVVETELMNLHEGNIARYWISPAQFKVWKAAWG